MQERHRCVDCSRFSPPTESGYTLISKEFGWRLTRSAAADGSFLLEWRCPPCWQKFKAKQVTRPWEPARRPPPRIEQQSEDLTQSGEYSKAVFDEAYPPTSSPRSPSERTGPLSEPIPSSRSGLPRKDP